MGILIATKAFFKLLTNRELSESFQQLLDGKLVPRIAPPATPVGEKGKEQGRLPASPPPPVRSDAVSLLSALQREARFVDLVKEPLDSYSDAQIGGAARDVLKNSSSVLDRMFGIMPLAEVEDGAQFTTPETFDPAEFRLMGNVVGKAPFTGTVLHHGWKATRCEIPQWSGRSESAKIVAPIELEVS